MAREPSSVSTIPAEAKSWRSWFRWRWLWLALAVAIVFIAATVILPRVVGLYWGYYGIRDLFHNELGRSAAESDLAGIVGAFLYAFLWVPMLLFTLWALTLPNRGRRLIPMFGLWLLFYGLTPVLRMALGSDICFNQETGEPLKWYVKAPDGTLAVYDSDGFDRAGLKKEPVTPAICRIVDLQKGGIRPREILDPTTVAYFDGTTGNAQVWYSKNVDGRINLFDAEGFDPTSGRLLLPITEEIVAEHVEQVATDKEAKRKAADLKVERDRREAEETAARIESERRASIAQAQRDAREVAARIEAEEKQKALRELVAIFDPQSYANNVVILGGASTKQDELSKRAVALVVEEFAASLRAKGLTTDRIRPAVYASGDFDQLVNGNAVDLIEVGLAEKIRSALLVIVDATCRPASSVADVASCTLSAKARILAPRNNTSLLREYSETGAGTTNEDAIARAAQLLRQRHPDIFEGV